MNEKKDMLHVAGNYSKQEPKILGGRYVLLHKIASGGMATIFLGKIKGPEEFSKFVALKLIHPHIVEDQAFLSMFLDEAKITSKLLHPNIAQVIELGKEGKRYFLVMEFIEGETLANIIYNILKKRLQHLSYAQAAWIISESCKGLHFAHSLRDDNGEMMSIIHRDISPHNIMISYTGHVKVIDFGIAKAKGRISHTSTGTVKGKFAYMSPEQATGAPLDARSDIFSVGIVLYEITLHKRLFKKDNDLATLNALIYSPIPLPTQIDRNYPPELERIVMKALQRDPNFRYNSILEMHYDLEMFIRNQKEIVDNYVISQIMNNIFHEEMEVKKLLKNSGTTSIEGLEDILPENTQQSLTFSTAPQREPIPTKINKKVYTIIAAITVVLLVIGVGVSYAIYSNLIKEKNNTSINTEKINKINSINKISDDSIEKNVLDKEINKNEKLIALNKNNDVNIKENTIEKIEEKTNENTQPLNIEKIEQDNKTINKQIIREKNKNIQPVRTEYGYVNINSVPWSIVYYNNKELGATPLIKIKLPAGKIKLKLYPNAENRYKIIPITVEANKTIPYKLNLN